MGIIGSGLLLWAIYFLFHKGYNQMFMIGTVALVILGENAYLLYKQKKCGAVSMFQFMRITQGALAIICFMWAVYMFCMKEVGGAMMFFAVSLVLVFILLFTRKMTEEKFLGLYEKYIESYYNE